MRKFVVVAYLTFALCGCAHYKPIVSTDTLTVVPGSSALPPPERSDLVAADRPAFVGPLDTIAVEVFDIPDLNREMQVDASGRIGMPLAGTIDVRGKTAEEVAGIIEAALRRHYVRDPKVVVNIKSSVSQVVTVDGQVVEPGLYPVTNQMTLMRVLASAKGLNEFARQEDVVILRTVGGLKMAGLYNIGAIRQGAYIDPAVYANDIVIVGDSPQRRRFRDLVSLAPLLAAPLVAVLN